MLLLIYFALVLLLVGFNVLVVINFWRYRFEGDKTALFISLFVVSFILTMGATLFFIDPSGLSADTGTLFEEEF